MLKALCLLFFVVMGSGAYADDQQTLAEIAGVNYQQGNYTAAISSYLQAIEAEPDNASLHHNLGLALEQEQKIGAAIAAYLRAVQLQPQDPDFRYNLKILLQRTAGGYSQDLPRHGLPAWLWARSQREIFYGAVLLMLVGSVLVVWNNLRTRPRPWLWLPIIVMILLSMFAMGSLLWKSRLAWDPGAIASPQAKLYATASEDLFVLELYEGAPFQILEESGAWLRIELADQKTGWIQKDKVVSFSKQHRYLPLL